MGKRRIIPPGCGRVHLFDRSRPRFVSALITIWFLCSSAALFLRAGTVTDPPLDEATSSAKREQAVLAGGCFWGMELLFGSLKGVHSVVSGYSGGEKETAHSDLVEGGRTGHAESVIITYDPSEITYGQILKVFFFAAHDPTQLDRQGPDAGTQYRSVIFYTNEEQKKIAESYILQLDAAKAFPSKIVTEVSPLKGFYPAEKFLQHYSRKHPTDPYVVQNDLPRLQALRQKFPELTVAKE